MFSFKTVALATAMALAAGAANAATETFSFLGNHSGTYYKSISFTGNSGGSVKVQAGNYGRQAGSAYVAQWTGHGLGVCSVHRGRCDREHYVDGRGKDEYLKFTLSRDDATITNIRFRDYGDNLFDLYAGGTLMEDERFGRGGRYSGEVYAGSTFFLGASNFWSGFKVGSVTVDYETSEVPLPAAGWMLIAGLGGLAAMRRNKK